MGPSPTTFEGEAGPRRRGRGRCGPCALRCRRKPRSRTPPPFGKGARATVSPIPGNGASAGWWKNGAWMGAPVPELAASLFASSNAVARSMWAGGNGPAIVDSHFPPSDVGCL